MSSHRPLPSHGEITVTLLGEDIPVIGPRLKNRCEALSVVKQYISEIDSLSDGPYIVAFLKQADNRYLLQIGGQEESLDILSNLDEFTVKRFQKYFKNGLFIITAFFEDGDDLECLAVTEGMGAVLYMPW